MTGAAHVAALFISGAWLCLLRALSSPHVSCLRGHPADREIDGPVRCIGHCHGNRDSRKPVVAGLVECRGDLLVPELNLAGDADRRGATSIQSDLHLRDAW